MDALAPEKPRALAAGQQIETSSLTVGRAAPPDADRSESLRRLRVDRVVGGEGSSAGTAAVETVEGLVDAALEPVALDQPASEPLKPWASSAAKRGLDVAVSACALLASAPLWAAIWVLNAATDRGPLLYVHHRVGRGGKLFRCYKFRTMIVDADRVKQSVAEDSHHDDPRTFKIRRDPRVTAAGRWLRKLSLDEVPQLVNVLVGDMSLVGPRPPLPAETELYAPRDWTRLAIKPGLTCIWQVSGRSDLPFERQLEMDLEYIERQGLLFDLGIMAKTVPAVISCRGAY